MPSATSTAPSRRGFDSRAFVGAMLTLTALGLPVTGVVNHLYQSAPMHLGRHIVMAAHNVLGLLFLIVALWHVVRHRRRLLRHLRGLVPGLHAPSRESLCAVGLIGLVLCIAVGHAFVL